MTLGGANAFTGTTTVKNGQLILGINNALAGVTVLTLGDGTTNSSGVLRLNANNQTLAGLAAAGTGTANKIVNGSTTASVLTINNSSASTFAGTLGGSDANENNFSLVKNGTGILTLAGTNTYTGGTTINTGTLAVSAATHLGATSGVLSIGNGTFQVTASHTSARAVSLLSSNSSIFVDTGLTLTQSGAVTGSGALTLTGPGTVVLSNASNAYSGGTNIRNGTLTLGVSNALPSATTVTLGNSTSSGRLALGGYNLTIAGLATSGTGTANRVVNGSATASTLTLNSTSNSTFAGILGGTGTNENTFGFTKTGAGNLTLTGTNTYTGTTRVSGGILAVQGGTTLSDSSALVLDNTAGATFQLNANETIGSLAGGGATGGNVNLQSFTITAGGDNSSTNYAGTISGTGNFTKSGTGNFTLSGANSFNGTTTVSAGTLTLSGGSAIADTGAVSLAAGSILQLTANETIGSLASSGNVTLQSFFLTVGAANTDTTYSGIISGTGGFTKTGTGNLTLSGANTYSGNTTISSGILRLGGTTAIPSNVGRGDLVIESAGTLDMNNRSQSVNGLSGSGLVTTTSATSVTLTAGLANATSTFSGNITNGAGTLGLTKNGTGTLTLSGTNTHTGNTTVSGGILALAGGSAIADTGAAIMANTAGATLRLDASETIGSLAGGGTTGGNVNLQSFTLSTGGNNASTTYNGIITDNGSGGDSLTKTGTGTLVLANTSNNTFTGGVNINAGILNFSRLENLGASGPISFNGGTLQYATGNTADITVRTVTTSATGGGTVDTNGNDVSFASGISGSGRFTKTGLGTLTLNAENSYTGNTTISAGGLKLGIANALPSGAGNGSVTVNGIIAPGDLDTIGTFAANSLTLHNTLAIQWNGTTNTIDLLNISGLFDLKNTSTVSFAGLEASLTQAAYIFATYGSLGTGRFANVTDLPAGYTINYSYGGKNIALVAIPEPATIALVALALAGLALRKRRRL